MDQDLLGRIHIAAEDARAKGFEKTAEALRFVITQYLSSAAFEDEEDTPKCKFLDRAILR
ncbi:hypothetical protein ACOTTU_10050 [Roseobacter sp. EG26]|uniref:hypothetical protein n=1 Tax=Roseobacter sp. EG26 TaxID=3412477 RepID=UPI003CE5A303